MIELAEEEEASAGSPAWMATFADLMSLLMCFFVLLLSFSEMDAQKYKLVAGSMKNAFGVQREVVENQNPSGSADLLENIRLQEFVMDPAEVEKVEMMKMLQELISETVDDMEKLEEDLAVEIQNGLIELESGFRTITIRIKEKGSFGSGSADLQEEFIPVMEKLQNVLVDVVGEISIEGHTDNIDISTARFASNWALSSARALSVGHELLRNDVLESKRFVISGYSDTVPFGTNDNAEGRMSNRRVEIIIRQPVSDEQSAGLRVLEEDDPVLQELLDGATIE